MSRLSEKIILALLGVFLIIYVGFQVHQRIYRSIKTESALEYTVSRTVSTEGIVIRAETLIDGNYGGIKNYLFENGTRVSTGEVVAEFSENNHSDRNLRRSRELESELKILREAQDASVNNFSTTESLNRDIKEQLELLSKTSNTGKYESSAIVRKNLGSLLNRKQIATGVAESFEDRISALTAEYEALDTGGGQGAAIFAKAPVSGYFCAETDGYETWLTAEAVKDYTINDYLDLINGESLPETPDAIAKIVTNQNWIYAAAASRSSLEFTAAGQPVTISFDSINKKVPATVAGIIQEKDNERAIILLQCSQVSGDLLELRRTNATLHFSQYTGLRVNMSDIRFIEHRRGVYILDLNNKVRFVEVDPVYEEQSFVLSRMLQPKSEESGYVRLFDKIITKGTDLYDGKVIQ